jgi:hypothetical protein
VGTAFELPFAARSFDHAVCWRLLHHIRGENERNAILVEIGRVVRGAIVLSFSDAATIKARFRRRRKSKGSQSLITAEQLAAEAERAGLSLMRVYRKGGFFSLVTGATLVSRGSSSLAQEDARARDRRW